MNKQDITVEDLEKAQQEASDKAIRINKALGLGFYVVRDSKLYYIDTEGEEKEIRKSRFGEHKVNMKEMKLKNVQ